jgi:putative peptidoglycan lipid II flippase
MVVSLFLSRILGLVREMVMSGKFGADINTDTYTLAFSIPDLLFFLVAGGALSSAFIPVFTEYYSQDKEQDAWHIFSVVATVMASVVLVFIAVAWIYAEPLARLVAPGKTNPAEIAEIAFMSRIVLPAQFAFFVGGLMFGTLYARKVFAVPGLGPNVYNLGIIAGALFISNVVTPSIAGMSWGALVGAIIGNLIIPAIVMHRMGSHYRPSFDVSHPGVKKVFKLMLPVILGLSLPGVYDLISRYYGSFYAPGVNSWLKYANVLMQAPLGVFGQSLAIAVFPALAQFYAKGEMRAYQSQLNSTLRQVLFITIPVSLLMAVASRPIVVAIFQHGQFTAASTSPVAELLSIFSVGVWAWCLHPVLMRAFFAVQHSVTPIVLGTITTFLYLGTIQALRPILEYRAIPAASSLSALVLVVMMLVAIQRRIGGVDFAGLAATAGKSVVGGIAFAGVTYALLQLPFIASLQSNKLGSVAVLLAVCLPGIVLYYGIATALKMPEAATLDRAMTRFRRSRQAAVGE